MSKTQENLGSAFAGESQANRKYLAFAQKAESEGKSGLAKIFRVAAEGETVHALNHLAVMGGIGDSKKNVESALGGETYEIETMYPGFIGETVEGEAAAKMSFDRAKKVEIIHQKMFREVLEKLEKGEEIADKDYYVCEVCGYPSEGEAPERCPVCGVPREKFHRV